MNTRPPTKKRKNICKVCTNEYFGYGIYYCSAKCRLSDKELRSCMTLNRIGKPHPISEETKKKIKKGVNKYYATHTVSEKTRKKLSDKLKGRFNPRWAGGEIKMGDYWYIWNPYHPRANIRHYVKRAIVIAEKQLGRFINQEEIIHHINCKKDDDGIENLYLFENESKHRSFHAKYESLKIPRKTPLLKSNLFK